MKKAVVIGGGIAGLTAAYYLHKSNCDFVLIERENQLGGRLKTDNVDGFVLDHGFQVMLSAYPELRAIFAEGELGEKYFGSGAILVTGSGNKKMADPAKHLAAGIAGVFNNALPVSDLLKLRGLKQKLKSKSIEEIFNTRQEITTLAYLTKEGFSEKAIDRFFKPFYGGIFLEDELSTSASMFEFTFKMFAEGQAALPKEGIQSIATSLANKLPSSSIRLNTEVISIDKNSVKLSSEESVSADLIIDARSQYSSVQKWNSATCMYFKNEAISNPFIYLDSRPNSPIKNIAILSAAQPSYAPAGQALISVTLRATSSHEKVDEVKKWLASALKEKPSRLGFLKAFSIPYALPVVSQAKATIDSNPNSLCRLAGDVVSSPSLNAAMSSSRKAVEALLAT